MKKFVAPIVLVLVVLSGLNSCNVNKATIDESLKVHFDAYKVDGCFTLFDNRSGSVTVYNMQFDTARYTPASTFKIVNSLIALETGKATDENMVIKWDSVSRWNPEWNKDLTMKQAFKVSSVPYYQEIARRIGKDTMQYWLDTLRYGNAKIGNRVDSFWLDNSLKVSPDEQLGLLKRLYFDQLPFQKRPQQIVRDMMLQEDNTNYRLSYKTGLGYDENGQTLGWVTGWVEENLHPYFFTLLVKAPSKDMDVKTIRIDLLKKILTQYGFFKGEK